MAQGFCCGATFSIVHRINRAQNRMTRPSDALAITAVVLGCALGSAPAAAEETKPLQKGVASWYGPGFHGKKTANGERFNTNDLTVPRIRPCPSAPNSASPTSVRVSPLWCASTTAVRMPMVV